jgi:hypothetical protein
VTQLTHIELPNIQSRGQKPLTIVIGVVGHEWLKFLSKIGDDHLITAGSMTVRPLTRQWPSTLRSAFL